MRLGMDGVNNDAVCLSGLAPSPLLFCFRNYAYKRSGNCASHGCGYEVRMTPYFMILAFLIAMTLIDRPRWHNLIGAICAIVLVIFAGLRYETGFDWLEYETYFDYSAPLGLQQPDIESQLGYQFEIGYVFLNRLLITFGLDFEYLLFFSSIFGIVPILLVARVYKSSVAFVFLVYFGFVFLVTQMAILRQSLAFGALLMGITATCQRRTVTAMLWVIIAVAFHSFVLALAPLLFIKRIWVNAKIVIAVSIFGLALSFIGVNVFVWLSERIFSFAGVDLIATKIEFYAGIQPNAISPQTLILIVWHSCFLIYIDKKYKNFDDVSIRTAYLFTIACLLFHCYFAIYPIFWQRAMAMAFVIQAAIIYRDFVLQEMQPLKPLLAKAIVSFASLFALSYTLFAESSIVYIPYQNIVILDWTNERGDGRLRYLEARREGSEAIRQSRLN